MDLEPQFENPVVAARPINSKHIGRLTVLSLFLTAGGIALFTYFVLTVGFDEILNNVTRFGIVGFAIILLIYFLRICMRAVAWKLSVYEPYELGMRDTVPAVIIGEALSSMVPLGILISGTAKAVAVRKRVPLVVGLSSVATENLFYSVITSVFLILGAFFFATMFPLDEGWRWTIYGLIGAIFVVIVLLSAMVIRQWHFASETCEWIYQRGLLTTVLEHGRLQVRLFENFIYGFYRRYPSRFLPICGAEATFHMLGVLEAWFILARLSEVLPTLVNAFLLESVSRLITIVFKLVPFLIGVDEAGARFVAETVSIGVGLGVTLAIIRKGRILFWTAVGIVLIVKRGLSLAELRRFAVRQNGQ